MIRSLRLSLAAAAAAFLTGCASLGIDDAVKETNASAAEFTGGKLELSTSQNQRVARASLSEELLGKPLTQEGAVQLALANSPALQALIAQNWADIAAANQAGRIPNPVFSFERVRR